MKTGFITRALFLGAAASLMAAALFFLVSCVSKESALEEAPIITSATYQHTQYNGRRQAVEVHAAKDDAPPFVITYFASEDDLENDRNGRAEAPVEAGDYYVRIERPGGNGYKQGGNIKVEYHIQKAFISIIADPVQRFAYDGEPKPAEASIEPPVEPPLVFSYFAANANDAANSALPSPPAAKGVYRVVVVFPGNERCLGASTEIALLIE
ncbi:MAG: hypothetical protein LBD58_04615 [Treponema sp.]|jgi:hypothetical protein|nr:hypothetical protein [Treponema sp.]